MTMRSNKKRTRPKPLSYGRPPAFKSPSSTSHAVTRSLIRRHHTLQKQKAQAVARGDKTQYAKIVEQLDSEGGIEKYQEASLLGQRQDRGGDSSKILLHWLEPVLYTVKDHASKITSLRMLEIGALCTRNACSRSRLFEVTRIDLRSTEGGIEQQDFMERPLPEDDTECFHIISLSLVLNYVPDPIARGRMLLRTLQFLKTTPNDQVQDVFPSLFLVLPVACIANSRYMDVTRLNLIMNSLGYTMIRKKLTNKLIYYLFKLEPRPITKMTFKKEAVRAGARRNNFAIVLN